MARQHSEFNVVLGDTDDNYGMPEIIWASTGRIYGCQPYFKTKAEAYAYIERKLEPFCPVCGHNHVKVHLCDK